MYKVIKDDVTLLKKSLKKLNQASKNCQEEYYKIREEYNLLKHKVNITESEKIEIASIFIYLNKRSFNGLYRENLDGKYNVLSKQNIIIYLKITIDTTVLYSTVG
jgi:DNA adenine methylase